MTTDVYLQSPAGEVIPIPIGQSGLGRESSNQIVVDDPAVSRQHLHFQREADQVWVTDLNSANGTFINDQRLAAEEMYPLKDGDRINLGGRMTFTVYGANPAANASDVAATMLLSSEPPSPGLESPLQPYMHAAASPQKPGKVQAIAIMCLIDGILNILWGIGLTCTAISTLIGILLVPLTIYPLILGILEIIYASRLLPDSPSVQKPAQYLAIMQLVNIITGDIISVVIGIISLVFYGDVEVKAYFNTLASESA